MFLELKVLVIHYGDHEDKPRCERRGEQKEREGRVGAKATLQIATKNGRRASRNAEERGSGSAVGGKNDAGGAESDHHDDGEEGEQQ